VRLYAWLIAPLKVYARHEKEFLANSGRLFGDVQMTAGFKLLKNDPESRLVIYCKYSGTRYCKTIAAKY